MFPIERRDLDRYNVPEAKVLYQTPDGLNIVVDLIDISISSVRFKLSGDFNENLIVKIVLIIPSHDKIFLKGKVVRISKTNAADQDYAAFQFTLFGSDERYNSSQSYKQLKKVIADSQEVIENFRRMLKAE